MVEVHIVQIRINIEGTGMGNIQRYFSYVFEVRIAQILRILRGQVLTSSISYSIIFFDSLSTR